MKIITNAEKAYEFILERIITAEMAPGSVIEEPELMEMCALGRTPVREALKRLEVERFVTVSPRRGMFVTPISYADINRIYEVRQELEALNIRLATERITTTQLEALEIHVEHSQAANNCSIQEQIFLDRQFHFLTFEASHNPWLNADLKRYYYMSQRIWYYAYKSLDSNWVGLKDHLGILQAVKEKNADQAEINIRKHLENFQKHIKEYLF